ncbi:MAG: hypothetical protein HYV27_22815 [Candidatus Hydrogenedentes bacterium]|nr:hypothetical protein [Candidatus Hydrogenedentota bacterium]
MSESFDPVGKEMNSSTAANEAWLRFAAEQGVRVSPEAFVDRSLGEFICNPSVRQLWDSVLNRVRSTNKPITFSVRCDSPECRRFMEIDVSPQDDGQLLFANRLIREEPRTVPSALDPYSCRTEDIVVVCSVCSKIRTGEETWMEAEGAVSTLGLMDRDVQPVLSHGLCRSCLAQFEVEMT